MSDTDTSIPNASVGESLQLPVRAGAHVVRGSRSTLLPTGEITIGTHGATALAQVIDIDRLWEAPPGMSSQVVLALDLLRQVIELIGVAKNATDPIEADSLAQSAQMTLPKLFSCRAIGDGFGITINSLYFAFRNMRGMPLSSEQLSVIWRILRELRARPVLPLDQGLQLVEELENGGLDVDPAELGDLVNIDEL